MEDVLSKIEKEIKDVIFITDPYEIKNDYDIGYNNALAMAKAIVMKPPAVDAVEVTRCEKCQYRFDSIDSESKEEVMFCNLEHGLAGIINSDDFCSYGERRDENAVD